MRQSRYQTGNLLGNLEIEDRGEAVDSCSGKCMPPAYLQEQTEANIDRFTGYLRHESDDLEIYVELEEPLERIETAVLNKAHQVIDELEIAEPEMEEPASSGCSPSAVQRLASGLCGTGGPVVPREAARIRALAPNSGPGVPPERI